MDGEINIGGFLLRKDYRLLLYLSILYNYTYVLLLLLTYPISCLSTKQSYSLPESIRHRDRYLELLRRAREEDLSELEESGCLYRAPCRDRLGRAVVVLIGKWFRPQGDLEKALLYLIKVRMTQDCSSST